jgi:hypothetical protein
MAFDGKALNCIFDWWFYHGNPKISIWLDYGGELFFYDSDRAERVARVMRLGDGPCFLDYDAKDDPFTDQEHQELAKFVRANNAKFYD